MRLKPKTVRRLTLLAVVAVLVAISAVGLIVVRRWNNQRRLEDRRAEGFRAFDRQDYSLALDRLGPYLNKNRSDAEAWIRYCRARWQKEEPDGRHALQAMHWYREYLGLRPDDREAGLELLRIYNTVGDHQVEALELAKRFRPDPVATAGPEHVPVLREEFAALLGGRNADLLDAVVKRLIELAPLDLDAQLNYIDRQAAAGAAAKAAEHARALRDAYPDDPRAAIIQAYASAAAGQSTSDDWIRDFARAVGLDPAQPQYKAPIALPDEPSLLRLVALFDRLGRFDLARAVLNSAEDPVAMPLALRVRVRRAWQSGDTQGVLDVTEGVSPEAPEWPAEVLGFRAAALAATGREPEARTLAEQLAPLRRDFRAPAWAKAAVHVAHPTGDPTAAAPALDEAIKAHPREPVFQHARAEALVALNRAEEAVANFRAAAESNLSVGWAAPWLRLAQVSLSLGLIDESRLAADRAVAIEPRSVVAMMTLLNARLARIERSSGPTDDETGLLGQIERLLEALKAPQADPRLAAVLSDQLLPGRVLLLARANRPSEATRLVQRRFAESDTLTREVLERLALISVRERLGFETEALDRAEQAHGPAASTAAVRAHAMASTARIPDAIAMLAAALEKAPADQRRDYATVRAVFLDQVNDPAAGETWKELAATYPDDPKVQEAILRSRAAAGVQGLVDEARERLISLTRLDASRSSVIRISKARTLLTEPVTAAARDEAIPILRAVISEHPQLIEPRLMLAEALLITDPAAGMTPDIPAAIRELQSASALAPDAGPITLRIAELLQGQRDFDGARAELSRLVRDPAASPPVRRRAAQLLAAQGLHQEAIPAFEAAAADGGEAEQLALAELYALARRDAQALPRFRAIAGGSTDPDRLAVVSVWLHRLGDRAGADEAVERIAALDLPAAQREMVLGRCGAGRRDWNSAAAHFSAAAAADPGMIDAWVSWIEALVAGGDTAAAINAAKQARERHPADARISIAEQRAAAAASAAPDLAALAAAMAGEPGNAATAAVITAVEEARRAGALDRDDGLAALADRFPESWPVQNLVIGRLMELQPPRTERATRLLDRAMNAFPAAADPARLAFGVYAGLGWWDRALNAALEWEQRDATRSFEPVAAIAEARIRLDRPRGAWEALQPVIRRAQQSPDLPEAPLAIGLAVRALLAAGQPEEAWNVVASVLPRSAAVRTQVLAPLVATGAVPAADVLSWIDRAERDFPQDPAERATLARACTERAGQNAEMREPLLARAATVIAPFAGTTDPAVLIVQAEIDRLRGDRALARATCQRALEADPSSISALEALARASAGDPDGHAVLNDAAARFTERAKEPTAWLVAARAYQAAADSRPAGDAAPLYRAAFDAYQAALKVDPAQLEALAQGALAAERAGDDAAALRAYDAALALPALQGRLRHAVQNNAAYFLATRPKASPESLRRALTLAREVTEAAPLPPYLDTLASIQLALGQRPDAIATYRRALNAEAGYTGCIIGLAEVLSTGPAPDQEEARRLLARLSSATLSPEHQARYEALRESLAR